MTRTDEGAIDRGQQRMKIAIVVPAIGSPGALATTAFTGALVDGLTAINVETCVVGLMFYEADWVPEALGTCGTSAPWLPPTDCRLGDRAEAARRGIFDQTGCEEAACDVRWRLELLLERALLEFAPEGQDNVVLADTRSHLLLRVTCRVAHRLGWRVVVISNEALTDLQIDPATRDDYIRCVTRCVAGIWAFSDHLADYWASLGVASKRVFVNPPVVRPSSFARPAAPPCPTSAVYLGNLAHREIDSLLEISKKVVAQVPDFKLTIYGDAPRDTRARLTNAAHEQGVEGVISVEPPVLPVDVPGVLDSASVLLLPRARGEFSTAGFPNKLGEYLASGRPVVVTAVGDIPKYLTNGESALIVEPNDNEAFAEAVIRVLECPEMGATVGAEGRRVAERIQRADVVAERLTAFIESLPPAPASPATDGGMNCVWRRVVALRPDWDLLKRDIRRALSVFRKIR